MARTYCFVFQDFTKTAIFIWLFHDWIRYQRFEIGTCLVNRLYNMVYSIGGCNCTGWNLLELSRFLMKQMNKKVYIQTIFKALPCNILHCKFSSLHWIISKYDYFSLILCILVQWSVIQRRTLFCKCMCEIQRNKVVKNATWALEIE